jgi:hypothetical protein
VWVEVCGWDAAGPDTAGCCQSDEDDEDDEPCVVVVTDDPLEPEAVPEVDAPETVVVLGLAAA